MRKAVKSSRARPKPPIESFLGGFGPPPRSPGFLVAMAVERWSRLFLVSLFLFAL